MFKRLWAHKKLTIFVVIILALAGWFIFGRKPAVQYTEFQVTSKNLVETLELSGKVTAGNYANIHFPVGGLVTYLGAQKGDVVKKYQTIASLDTRQLQKVLDQKLNLYASTLTTFDDTKASHQQNIDSNDIDLTLKRILSRNQHTLENAVKDVEYQDLSIKLARLTSPIAGILISAPLTVSGVNVGAADIWTVVDPTSLQFSADLSVDTSITTIAFAPKETTSGTTYEIKLAIPMGVVSKLRLGLNGTATIVLNEKNNVPSLPAQAVTYKGGITQVLVNKDGKYVSRDIKTGTETSNDLEIVSGLSLGDKVYVKK